jgi:cytochrome P450
MAVTRLPRGPRGHWLLGNLAELRRDWLGSLTRYAQEYGDVVPLRFGPFRSVLISRPDLIEEVLVTQSRKFIKGPALRNNQRVLGQGLLVSEGEFWRRQRRLVQPAFHRQRLAGYAETMVTLTREMLATWRDGETRDLHVALMDLTLQIAARTLFGADVAGAAAEVADAFRRGMEYFNTRMNSLLFLLPDGVPTPGYWGYLQAARRLDAVVYGILAERRTNGEDRDDVLSMLLQARDEDGGQMTDRQVRDETMTLLLAGHETTTIVVSWTWYLLSQHPAAEARLLAEVDAVLGERPATSADLPRLRYTDMVVTEAMRLYPPAWAVTRETIEPCEIGGYHLGRRTGVMMSQWVMHRDPRYFDAPEAFRPERWADESVKSLPRFVYFPFGGGPRLCIGNAFATMEAILVTATIAQRYRLRLAPEAVVVPAPPGTLRPRHGMPMMLQQRCMG